MALVTLAQAKRHLRIETETTDPLSPEDEDLTLKVAQAEAVVLDYLGGAGDAWTAETVPLEVQAALFYQLGELWRFRGDDAEYYDAHHELGGLSRFVMNLLRRHRDPTLV